MQKMMKISMKISHFYGYACWMFPAHFHAKLCCNGLICLCLCLHTILKSPHGISCSLKFLPSYTVCLVV